MVLSKTDYLLYRECKKGAWLKTHKPEIYYLNQPSEFEKLIMETGDEVESLARNLFPNGILIQGRDYAAQKLTDELIKKHSVVFQPVFENNGFLAAIDILEFNPETNKYSVYEVKSTCSVDKKIHYYDLAFQVNVLKKHGLQVDKVNLIHLNSEYKRNGDINPNLLFKIVDLTAEIESLCEEVSIEMDLAKDYLSTQVKPTGYCICIYKGRSQHCRAFSILNPDIPHYGVHDIARIGSSKKKLAELVDSNIFHIDKIPAHIKLSPIQQNQVDVYRLEKLIFEKDKIIEELSKLQFPLYFLDYETFPAAIPRFDSYAPYQQIPFQYALSILESPESNIKQLDFLHVDANDPCSYLANSLKEHISDTGSIIVWNKTFECGRNSEIAEICPEVKDFMESINSRTYDLMDIFKNQYYVHKDFRGSYSIKKVLPVLSPSFTYSELEIQDGGSAAQLWNKMMVENIDEAEKQQIINNLKAYCGMDANAMYSIWKELYKIVSNQ